MENYKQIKVLGKGSFGSAWLVQRNSDKQHFVAKEVRLAGMKPHEKDSAKHEIAMLRTLNHPNITKYIDHFEHRGALYIVMEYANGGDLHQKIKSRNGARFTEKEILHYFSQLCLALLHLHEKRILHRDLKSLNVFLTADGVVKLGDFGISTVLRNTCELKRTVCGTPYYFSPELCLSKPYNNKSDVWALGCILYELTTLKHAFDGNSMQALVQKILKGAYPPIHSSYSPNLSKLIESMLKIDPQHRPNVNQLVQLDYIRNFLSGLQGDVHGANNQKVSCVNAVEQQRLRNEAQARLEMEKANEAKRMERAKQLQEEREREQAARVEAVRRQVEAQQKEHDEKLRRIREQQKQYEEQQAEKRRQYEAQYAANKKAQAEKAAAMAKIQKQREEEWEQNMKAQQEEYRRKQQLQQQQQQQGMGAEPQPMSPGPMGGAPNARKPEYNRDEAARMYHQMRREAEANRLRAHDDAPQQPNVHYGSPASPHQPQGGAGYGAPSAGAAPRQATPSKDDLEEQRKAAYWQMRREAEENRRRITGQDPLPPPVQQQAPVSPKPLSPKPQPVVRQVSPPQVVPRAAPSSPPPQPVYVAPPPAPPAAAAPSPLAPVPAPSAAAIDSDDDEDIGYHRFLNGEAVLDEDANAKREQDYDGLAVAIAAALDPNAAACDDFADEDDNDPTRFVLDGQTLHLPRVNSEDPLMHRIESLRLFLEVSMGEENFIRAYRILDNPEVDDDDLIRKAEAAVPESCRRYLQVISQLIVCEEFFHRQ